MKPFAWDARYVDDADNPDIGLGTWVQFPLYEIDFTKYKLVSTTEPTAQMLQYISGNKDMYKAMIEVAPSIEEIE